MNEYLDSIVQDKNIDDGDIRYHKTQFKEIGAVYVLKHPYLSERMEDEYLYLAGDCYFCDTHSDENLMCVTSRKGKEIFSICQDCYFKHNFINFNL